MRRIYLDNAATSWPKPEPVYQAVERCLREVGASAGRSAYREATEAQRLVEDARRRVADLIGAEATSRVVFTSNGTDSLNLALHGLLRPGDHVVTTTVEHNSVLRPLCHLEQSRGVAVSRVACDRFGLVDPQDIRRQMRPNTRLVAMIHASNVTGAIQPVEEAGRLAHEHEALLLVDAAQSLGHVPVNVRQLQADLLAAPGHKGLLGPLGTGILYLAPGVERLLAPVRQGGTGTRSEDDRQPESLPDRYESGNHNVPALAGLAAALAWIGEQSLDELSRHEQRLTEKLIEGLTQIEGAAVCGPAQGPRVGVVSLVLDGVDPQEAAAMLDVGHRVQARAGLHCAPLVHQALGTASQGGTLRLSVGPFVSDADIDAAVAAVEEIVAVQSM